MERALRDMEYSIFIMRRSVYQAGIKIWRCSKNSVFISTISFNISKNIDSGHPSFLIGSHYGNLEI